MTEKEQKQHWLSAFHIRRFTCDLMEERDKNKLRVQVLDKHGKIEKKRINSLCQIRGYNSTNEEYEAFELMKSRLELMKSGLEQSPNKTFEGTNQKVRDIIDVEQIYELMETREAPTEVKFERMELKFADSIDAILEGNQRPKDIVNMKYLMMYFLSNSPNYRAAVTRGEEGSVNERIKGKGFLTELTMSQTLPLLSDWKGYILRIKPTYNQQYITSDNPVHIQYTMESEFKGGWKLEYTNDDPQTVADGKELTGISITIPHDAIFFLPLNPLTGFYLYKNPKRMEDIVNTKNLIEKMNISQIRQSKEYAFSKSESYLKIMYEKSLDSNEGWI